MNILHVSSEVAPLSKTGGLGDVAGALPRALAGLGEGRDRVAVISPAYRIETGRWNLARRLRKVAVPLGGRTHDVEVLEGRVPGGGGEVRAWLLDHEVFRRGGLYGEGGRDYPDNAFRFALFSRAALHVPRALGFVPDVLHAHDWQAAGTLLYAARGDLPSARRVLTVHNLAFQGLFPVEVAPVLDLGADLLHPEGIEFYGKVSLLKAGLLFAERITTVSPRYAREIQTEEYGCGLEGFLQARADRVVGILNGADYEAWNPERDPLIPAHYSAADLAGKRACKASLAHDFHLPARPRTPLVGAVSRLTDQKGFDLVTEVLERLLVDRDLEVVILGTGDPAIEKRLSSLAARHPAKLAVRIGYDEALAHRIYAGSDLFVMPSRYEPCGLSQLYSLRYGTPPIVRATGGLDDTVIDYDPRSQSGNGFKFTPATPAALDATWRRALTAWGSDENYPRLVRRGMQQDFSWGASAKSYRALYDQIARPAP